MMAGAAHSPAFARKVGVPQKVAREFNAADRGTGILTAKSRKSTHDGATPAGMKASEAWVRKRNMEKRGG